MQDFKRLVVWQRAHALAIAVQRAAKRFPRTGHASIRSQITRAAESIATNIVEGCGTATQPEFARFLDIAIKSTSELEYHLLLARDYGILASDSWNAHSSEANQLRRMLYALRARVLAAPAPHTEGAPH
jgi:four helix bundle protein